MLDWQVSWGNSAVDSAAKAVLLQPVSSLTVPHSNYKSLIRIQALRQWQLRWNCETENKLHSIEPRFNVINIRLPRRDEIIIHRLRIWHTSYAWTFTSRGDSPSVLDLSNGVYCWAYLASLCFLCVSDDCFCVTLTSMSELFSKFASRSFIDFIKEIGFS